MNRDVLQQFVFVVCLSITRVGNDLWPHESFI